jgi:hypothetical protein
MIELLTSYVKRIASIVEVGLIEFGISTYWHGGKMIETP